MSNPRAGQMYEDIELLFNHGDPKEPLLNACYNAINEFPEESKFWYLSSRILQALERPDDARKDINLALKFDTFNVQYNLQLFNILIQQKQTDMIPRRINWLFDNAPPEVKTEIAKFAEVGIESGLFSKLDLVNDALVEILKIKNKRETN
jgi:hypothetical protein